MADASITPIINDITEMEDAFKQSSCNSKLPFVEYPSTGTPPVISFNVAQNTAFVTYGHLVKYFPVNFFKPFTKNVPENNYFQMVKNMTAQQANELFHPNVVSPITKQGPPLVPSKNLSVAGAPGTGANWQVAPRVVATGSATDKQSNTAPTGDVQPTNSTPTMNMSNLNLAPVNMNAMGSVAIPLQVNVIPPKPDLKADYATNLLRPYDVTRLNGQAPITKYVAKPPVPVPRIIVIEEYTTTSYLGNYGAGRTVKTYSLFPGERTTISVRTYKDRVTTKESSKNVLDSFSDASATALDELMQQEQGNISSTSATSGGSGTSFTTSTDSQNSQRSFGISGSLNLGPLTIGGGYGRSTNEVSTSSGGMSNAYNYSGTAVRQSNVNTLASALNKHVQQSNAVRQIDVNTSTTDVSSSGEEESTIREISNINLNHTLNIAWRQLLQEYTVITYLSNLKFAYTNGYPESYTVVDLCNLPNMLMDILDDTDPNTLNNVLCTLLQPYCSVMNYDDNFKQFVEKIPIPSANCLDIPGCTPQSTEYMYRIKKGLEDTYSDGVIDVTVKGVILKVQKQTLQTSSLIADALLGRGEALDCFNQKAQNAQNISAYISNLQQMQNLTDAIQTTANNQLFADQQLDMGNKQIETMDQQMDVITNITDPVEKATHYKKVFGDCCDVPQSCCGCGSGDCGCGGDTPTP